jgi:hypothetical protein
MLALSDINALAVFQISVHLAGATLAHANVRILCAQFCVVSDCPKSAGAGCDIYKDYQQPQHSNERWCRCLDALG